MTHTRLLPLTLFALVAVCAFAITQPEMGLVQAIVAGAVELAILGLAIRSAPGSTRELTMLVIVAALVRVVAAVAFHMIPAIEASFGQDAKGYDLGGRALADSWAGGPSAEFVWQRKGLAYYLLVGAQYHIFGYAPVLPKVTNAIIGAGCVLYVYRIGAHLHSHETGWRAATMVAFFPSLILWHSLNLRDALAILLVTVIVWHTLSLKASPNANSAVMLMVGLFGIGMVREYMFPLMGAAVIAGVFLTDIKNLPRNLVTAAVLGIVVFIIYSQTNLGGRFVEETSLQDVNAMRKGGAIGARTAFLTDVDTTTPLQALLFLPLGIAYFLLSPFPWQIGGLSHLMPLPEMLYWYWLIPAVVLGIRTLLRTRFAPTAVVLFGALVPIVSYGLVSSNVGTAYRHRGQVMPLLLTLGAVGLAVRDQRRRDRALGVRPGAPVGAPGVVLEVPQARPVGRAVRPRLDPHQR